MGAVLNTLFVGLTVGMVGGAVFGNVMPQDVSASPVVVSAAERPAAGTGPFAVGQLVRTDVGAVRVTSVVTIAAVTPAEVQVTFRLTNDTGTTVTVAPAQLTLDAVPATNVEPATPVLTG